MKSLTTGAEPSVEALEMEKNVLGSHGYKLTVKLAEGGYSKVYLCKFTPKNSNKNETNLACKLIDTKDIPFNTVKKFLPQELKILSRLNHPHIIQVHSIFHRKDKIYIFMRHAENGDLFDYIVDNGPIKESLAKYWIRQLCLAIQYLHILEIAHRDIKCENILITVHNNIKLSDFGFSRSTVDNNYNHILSDTYCGSVSYASPQIIDGVPYDPKSTDMWSLGCVIFIMLNKTPPFQSSNLKVMYEHQTLKRIQFRDKYMKMYTKDVLSLVKHLLEPQENIRYKIEQVLGSTWISMEPTLRVLNKYETIALAQAMELAQSIGPSNGTKPLERETVKSIRQSRMISQIFVKEYEEGFDLNLLNSEINIPKTKI